MKKLILFTFFVFSASYASSAQDAVADVDSVAGRVVTPTDSVTTVKTNRILEIKQKIKQRIETHLSEPYDTTRNKGYWWRAMKHGNVNFNDSTMGYPKFVKFCWRAYKWGDRAFNSYDPDYVVGTGKNWKLILKSDNWIDSYIGRPFDNVRMIMNSNLVSNIGVSLSFMAVSVGYSISVSNLIHGGKVSNKLDFSFTCARFTADITYWENKNDMDVTYTNKDIDDKEHHYRHSGITRKAFGASAYYFFNNRRYAQAAAYCFSKYQKRSAGSWLAGFSLQHYDLKFNKDLPEEAYDFIPTSRPRILYNDYCLLFGYGYNWVLGKKWLLNVTATPYLGYRNNLRSADASSSAFSINARLRLGAVYNHRKFFVGLQSNTDHHRYKSDDSWLVNSIITFSALAGIRF